MLDPKSKGVGIMGRRRLSKEAPPELEVSRFVNPVVAGLELVGSKELEVEIEKVGHEGREVIPVHGYPVVDPPAHLCQAATEAAKSTFSPPSNGLPALRESLSVTMQAQYGAPINPEAEIVITYGGMNGLHVVMTSLLRAGDETLLVSPCYFFGGVIEIAGGRPVYVNAEESQRYALDFERIRRSISNKTRLLILSSPVNPTGYVCSQADIEQFIALAEEYNLLLVSDESYDRMLYNGRQHFSPFHYPEGRSRSILVKSFTKSYALPTWRVGYVVAPAALTKYFRKVHEWTALQCPYTNQRVALAALEGPQQWLVQVFDELEKRRNQLLDGIGSIKNFGFLPPAGGPFIYLNVSRLTNNCTQYAQHLLFTYGIPAVPGKFFQDRDHLRVPFGGSSESVARLVAALVEAGRHTGAV